MKKRFIQKHSWLALAFYQFLTFGIYGVYWFNTFLKDAQEKGKEKAISKLLVYLYSLSVFLGIFIMIMKGYYYLMSSMNVDILESAFSSNLDMLNFIFKNSAWFLMIILAFQVRSYLRETYEIRVNWFFTLLFSMLHIQARVNKNYGHIEDEKYDTYHLDLSENEKIAKDYIEEYKLQYSREEIRLALIDRAIPQEEVLVYLDKYF